MNIQYQEKVPAYVFVFVMLLVSCLIFLTALVSQFTSKAVPLTMPAKIILGIVLLLSVVVLISFRELVITVTENQIILGFGYFKKKFYLGNIEKIEISEYKFSNYLGYGIRYGRDKTIGYTPRGGKGLKIKFKKEKRAYFFISERPEELKMLLEKLK